LTFKDSVYDICKSVAQQLEGWEFVSGAFRKKALKHVELGVLPGFGFKSGHTPLIPSISVRSKSVEDLSSRVFGKWNIPVSLVSFQTIRNDLKWIPQELRGTISITQDKEGYVNAIRARQMDEDTARKLETLAMSLTDLAEFLVLMMRDALCFIEEHYDLSSEESLLRFLPAKYTPSTKVPYSEWEMQKGVMMCLVRIVLGDFDFVEHYRSDEFKTIYPKQYAALDKIIAELPDLRKRFAQTGHVS